VRGHYKPDRNDRKDKMVKNNQYWEISMLSTFEKRLRVDMIAEITTLDQSILTKMKKAFDGKINKLGC